MWKKYFKFLEQQALEFVNHIRVENGLGPINKLEPGMILRNEDCTIKRSIGSPTALTGRTYTRAFGKRYDHPFWVKRFTQRFDDGYYPHLQTARPQRFDDSIDHLDWPAPFILADLGKESHDETSWIPTQEEIKEVDQLTEDFIALWTDDKELEPVS